MSCQSNCFHYSNFLLATVVLRIDHSPFDNSPADFQISYSKSGWNSVYNVSLTAISIRLCYIARLISTYRIGIYIRRELGLLIANELLG